MKCGFAVVSFCIVLGCGVSPAPRSTGGVTFDAPDGGPAVNDGGIAPLCDRGVVIVTSDFKSTNIAIAAVDGTTRSGSFVSSGATKPGLALALSGDVDVPSHAPASKHVVLLDRFGTNVVTWMDLASASVLSQLPIGTGFQSNPHDYLEVDEGRAFVSRYGTNATPGAQLFDQGGDLLIVDLRAPAIRGRIAIPEDDPTLNACPDGMTWLGSEVVVSLGRWAPDFSKTGDGRFVGVSPATNTVDWQVDVKGLQACGRLAVSPSGKIAAIACSSKEDTATSRYDPSASDIVLYDATVIPPKEIRRLGLGTKLNAGVQPQIAFASEDAIFGFTYGGNATPGDTVFAVSVTTGTVTPLAEATKPYVLGGMHCAPGCESVCLASDAERNKLRRWRIADDGTWTAMDDAVVDTTIGLPPRTIGAL